MFSHRNFFVTGAHLLCGFALNTMLLQFHRQLLGLKTREIMKSFFRHFRHSGLTSSRKSIVFAFRLPQHRL
jgi:hypothetical protein